MRPVSPMNLMAAGLKVRKQVSLPLRYKGIVLDPGYRLDLLVEDRVVIEVKAAERDQLLHKARILTYLRLGGYALGYVLNFNTRLLREGVTRVVNNLH